MGLRRWDLRWGFGPSVWHYPFGKLPCRRRIWWRNAPWSKTNTSRRSGCKHLQFPMLECFRTFWNVLEIGLESWSFALFFSPTSRKVRRMMNVSGSMSFSSCNATKDGGAFTADSVFVGGHSAVLQLQFSAVDFEVERSIMDQAHCRRLYIFVLGQIESLEGM